MIDITNIKDMTEDQLRQALTGAADDIAALEAERDSFREENETLKADKTKLNEELSNTKKLNFTLARKLDTGSQRESAEDILSKMFD